MRILKKLHFFLFVACFFGIGQAFAAWDGTSKTLPVKEDGYYIINTEAELAWYGANYNSGNAKLTADLDLGGHLWIPMAAGKGDKYYGKIFDGQNHIIKNLYINGDELSVINKEYAQNLGFVGVLGDGKVLNLILENVDIQATTNAGTIITNQDNQISVGAVVGWMSDKGTNVVDNCMTSGIIKTTGNSQGVGGIVGNAKKGTISNCMSLVEIQTSGSKAYIGGIIGITKTDVTVSSCIYAGPGLINTGTDGAVGGIAGNVWSGTISTENDFYEGTNYYQGEEIGGVGKFCKGCDTTTDQTVQVDDINSDVVICALNGIDSTTGACKNEPWSIGETGLSLNGYGIDGYKIVFDANGGAFANGKADKDKFLEAGMAITADEVGVPSRENHNFVGWAMTRDATAPVADLGTVSHTDTIFAVWAPVYTVTFNVAPGVFPETNESEKTKQVASGEVITVEGLGTLPTSRCKVYVSGTDGECETWSYFTGWALTAGAPESDSVSLDTVPASDELVLYAVWTDVETYTVTYNANKHGTTTVDYVRVGAGDTVVAPADPIADDGYVFAGWFTDSNGVNAYEFESQINQSIILYAKWTLQRFDITYVLNEGSVNGDNPSSYTIDTAFVLNAPADVVGYVFEGWFYDANFTNPASQVIQGTTGDKTFYAKWTKKTYRIMYLADNNSYGSISDQFVEHGTTINLESAGIFRRAGYEQTGWSTTMGGAKEYDFGESFTVVAPVTLYPSWSLVTYTITYECDGCVNNPQNPTTYTINDKKDIRYPQSREGYDFGGWYKETNYTTKVTQIAKGSYGNITLYGKWIKVYTLSYVLNGGEKANSRTSYTSETATFALGEATGREGYTFAGWYDNPDFEGAAVTEIPLGSSGDKTFYAKWVPDEPEVVVYGAVQFTKYNDGTTLAELDANSFGTIDIPTDVFADTVRYNRVFEQGKMSTIVLPFSVDTSKVHGGNFYEFAHLEKVDGKWRATVVPPEAGSIVANKPYLVMPTETAPLSFDLDAPVAFNTSEIRNSTSGNWTFKGTYAHKTFTADDPELGRAYGFVAVAQNNLKVGQFVKAGSGAWLRPMRAYLVNEENAAATRSVRASARRSMGASELPEIIEVEFQNGDGAVVGKGSWNTTTGEFKVDRWYDLQGRKLNGKPTTKGSYFKNGRRVIVK
ncbi:MAG: InlB B-repeat-containing protein [Fibrobacter sp.]|nr:InlB B-repeat-containing protein [Fibrobacter sp.]